MLKKIKDSLIKLEVNVKNVISKNKIATRIAGTVGMLLTVVARPAYAAPSVGQNGANWLLEQLSYIILATTVFLGYKAHLKGNTVKMVILGVVGGFLFVLCKNPTKIGTMGNWVFEIFGM